MNIASVPASAPAHDMPSIFDRVVNLAPRKYQDGLSKNSLLSRDSLQVRDHRPTGAPAASTAAQGGENEGAEGG